MVEWWDKEMNMKAFFLSSVFVGVAVVAVFGCGQETPAEKAKAAAASGNAAAQAAGQAAVDYVNTPLDKARQTEGILKNSAAQRDADVRNATQ